MDRRNLVCCLLGGLCLSHPCALAAPSAPSPLEWFLPNEATVKRLQPVLAQLESESFADREAASRQLAALPELPGFIRQLATTESRPESRLRLWKLLAAFPIAEQNNRLTEALQELASAGTKGQLETLHQVLKSGTWSPADHAVHDAARATVTPADWPLIEQLGADPSPMLRRLAAAAASGLPAAEATALLAGLLGENDPPTTLLAALGLAARQDLRALPALARLLDSPDFEVRHRSDATLRSLTGQDFGFDPTADAAARQAPAAKWRDWAASPAAAITGSVPKETAIALFNGRNLQGWEVRVGDEPLAKTDAWEVVAGELLCKGKPFILIGDLWTTTSFENYVLNLQYHAADKNCDSGIGVLLTKAGEQGPQAPHYLEVQLLPGNSGDIYQIGGCAAEVGGKPIAFQAPRLAEVKDDARAWHQLKLTVRHGTVEVALNGVVVNRTTKGPQGPGRIVLRNEGCAMTFRNLILNPLPL